MDITSPQPVATHQPSARRRCSPGLRHPALTACGCTVPFQNGMCHPGGVLSGWVPGRWNGQNLPWPTYTPAHTCYLFYPKAAPVPQIPPLEIASWVSGHVPFPRSAFILCLGAPQLAASKGGKRSSKQPGRKHGDLQLPSVSCSGTPDALTHKPQELGWEGTLKTAFWLPPQAGELLGIRGLGVCSSVLPRWGGKAGV